LKTKTFLDNYSYYKYSPFYLKGNICNIYICQPNKERLVSVIKSHL